MLEILVIKLWMVGLLISSILAFKRRQTAFYCGIFGASLNPKVMAERGMLKAAIAKFKLLGMYNVDRGRHSCGIYMGDVIGKGVDADKLFSDYISAHDLPDPEKSGIYTMIGHTRAATHGSHNSSNAHPFIVEDNFILAHNGIIRNIWPLCNKYKIIHTNIHVDSLGLAHLINQEGFGILDEYEGFAALLMARRNEPNSLYVYRGVSSRYTNGPEEEERPLFYLHTEEGIYFSSMEKSLLAISDTSGEIVRQLEGNVVHKITNGVMTKVKHFVTREKVNYGVNINNLHGTHTFPKQTGPGTQQRLIGPNITPINTDLTPTNNSGTNSLIGRVYTPGSINKPWEKIVPLAWHETLPKRIDKYAGKKGIIYHMGRFWIVESDAIVIADGSYYINTKGIVSPNKKKSAHNYYFFNGVMIKNLNAWNEAKADPALRSELWNHAFHLSKYCSYPITNSKKDVAERCKDVSDYMKYRWYENQVMCKNTGFTPRFSDRNYIIHDGLLKSISTQKGTMQEPCIDIDGYKNARDEADGIKVIGKVEENSATPTRPPMVIMPQSKFHEVDELPFPDPEKDRFLKDIKPKTVPEWDVTHFYQIFESVEDAIATFTPLELRAIGYYVCDIMANEMGIYADNVADDQVQVQMNMLLSICVENKVTVMDNWDDKNYKDILDYLLLAEENKDGVYFDESVEDVEQLETGESCGWVPKTDEDKPRNLNEIIAEINNIKEDVLTEQVKVTVNGFRRPPDSKLYIRDERIVGNYQDSVDGAGDPPVIDQIVANEMRELASIPKDGDGPMYEESEDHTYTEMDERDFAFQDSVDYLYDVRDCADEMQGIDDDFSQDAASIIYRTIDPLLRDLRELTIKHNEVDLDRYIKEVLSKRVNVNA